MAFPSTSMASICNVFERACRLPLLTILSLVASVGDPSDVREDEAERLVVGEDGDGLAALCLTLSLKGRAELLSAKAVSSRLRFSGLDGTSDVIAGEL